MKNKKSLIAFMLIILHLIYLPSCDSIKKYLLIDLKRNINMLKLMNY